MLQQQKGANKTPNQELLGKAEEALGIARAMRQMGVVEDACEMYDDAFMILASELGEAHHATLEVQREYSIYLTALNMLASSQKRRLN